RSGQGSGRQMSEPQIDLDSFMEVVEERRFGSGDIVFSAGDAGDEMFIVKSGRVEIRVGGQPVETVERSGFFGEMAISDGARRSATAIAIADSVLVPVSEAQFLALTAETPAFALAVMRALARRLRQANRP